MRSKDEKKDFVEGLIEKTEFPNKGTFAFEDREITVKGVIQGQRIARTGDQASEGKAVARLVEVLSRLRWRMVSQGVLIFGTCGGCFYQMVSDENQLRIKEGQVRELLKDYIPDEKWEGIKGSPKWWEYRNKMEFSFGDEVKGGPLALGMHKKNTFHDIVNITDCKIVDNDYNLLVSCALNYFSRMGCDFYHKMSHEGYLRHLVIRRSEANGDLLVNIVTTSQADVEMKPLAEEMLSLPLHGSIRGILHTMNDSWPCGAGGPDGNN